MTDYRETCGDECPLECEMMRFELYTTSLDYPSTSYAKSLINNPLIRAKYASNITELTHESLKRNLVQISVYYADLGYSQFDEVASMTWIDLTSSIGGTLGLFLGMSFLSFMEFFDIFLQIIFYKRNN